VWYGGLTLLGSSVGANWGVIRRWFGRVNAGLGVVAGLALVGLVLWILARRKARRRERLAALAPFDPAHPEQPAPMVDGLPVISADALEQARLARPDSEAPR
jgi:hypothetical protein